MKKIFAFIIGIALVLVLNMAVAQDELPDLVVTSFTAPTSASTQQQVEISWTVKNQGNAQAQTSQSSGWIGRVYFSTDNQIDGNDQQLAAAWHTQPLLPDENYTATTILTIPNVPTGTYYLILEVDQYNYVYESDETNNTSSAKPITITIPDLIPTSFIVPGSASTQQQVEISWTVKNQGSGAAIGSSGYYSGYGNIWYDNLYLSTDNILDNSDRLLVNTGYLNKPLAAGESYTTPYTIKIPEVPAGDYYLLLQADSQSNKVYESKEDNNIIVKPITIRVPDLAVISIQAPNTVSPQQQVEISWTVRNQGNGDAVITYLWTGSEYGWYLGHDIVYLSTDEQLDDNDQQIANLWHAQPLPAGESYTETTPVTIPNLPVGTYYLLVKADEGDYIYESSEWNNVSGRLITIGEKEVLSETSSSELTLTEDLLSQKAASSNLAVIGDLTGTFNFFDFEITKVNSGSFIGRGFTKGQWNATLEGIFYQGYWQGVLFPVAKERKIYLKGIISGSDAGGIIDGYLTESVPESGVYDQYHAIWKLNQLADKTVFVTLNLEGSLNYLQTTNYPATEFNVLQIAVSGKTTGHYNEPIDTVLTHLRVVDAANPYNGQGCSIISYVTKNGSGEGWTFDELTTAGKISLLGQFSSPLLGIVSGSLDGAISPRTLSLSIERIDLALPPAPELRVKVWGPQNVSPGQTVNYIIEYRNDGVKAAENVFVSCVLNTFVKYISASEGVYYSSYGHQLSWKIGKLPAKTNGYLNFQVEVMWGLPTQFSLEQYAYITNIGE